MMSRQRSGDADTRIITRHSIAERRKYATRILVVEDKETNLVVAKALLNKLGFEPDSAKNGQEAVEKVRSASYDIVLMDSQMPVMDGFEATRRIRDLEVQGEVGPVRIIAMTANAFKQDREKCLAAGMNDYVAKPIDRVELLTALNKNIAIPGAWSDEREIPPNKTGNAESNHPSSLPGLDVDEGLKRLGVSWDEYVGILGQYNEIYSNFIEDFSGIVKRNDFEAARLSAHSLKGAANNLSAKNLGATALDLENACVDENKEVILDLLGKIEKDLAEVGRSFREAQRYRRLCT
jgi:two-component system sensor histidine kinase/response regulator